MRFLPQYSHQARILLQQCLNKHMLKLLPRLPMHRRPSQHPEQNNMLDWYGDTFDPSAFDHDDINQRLKRIKV